MTAIGVLNIIFGALGTLVCTLMVLGAGLLAAGGASMGGNEGTAAATAGGLMLLIGIGALACNLLLFISGIGVLKLAPWGRSLGIAYGILGIVIYGATLATGGLSLFNVAFLGYSVLLLALFFRPAWKAAFGAGGSHDAMHDDDMTGGTHMDVSGDESREAA